MGDAVEVRLVDTERVGLGLGAGVLVRLAEAVVVRLAEKELLAVEVVVGVRVPGLLRVSVDDDDAERVERMDGVADRVAVCVILNDPSAELVRVTGDVLDEDGDVVTVLDHRVVPVPEGDCVARLDLRAVKDAVAELVIETVPRAVREWLAVEVDDRVPPNEREDVDVDEGDRVMRIEAD